MQKPIELDDTQLRNTEKVSLVPGSPSIVSNYGSTSSTISDDSNCDKMAAANEGVVDTRNGSDLTSSLSQVAHYPRNRRISSRGAQIPSDTGEKWHELLRRLAQLKFRRASSFSNQIHTTKYTILTFLPKNLFEKFHRLANLYFLLIIILNFIPAIEVFGKEVSWVPLFVILTITALKDGFEDYRRYRSDQKLNALPCYVFDNNQGGFVRKAWKDVRVGDIVRLICDDIIPADMVLLWSSDSDNLCYIQTSTLDGETNLKQRQVPPGILEETSRRKDSYQNTSEIDNSTEENYSYGFDSQLFTSELHCEPPNQHVYKFKGYIKKPDESVVPLNHNHLLLRGCILRNTNCAVGVVVYAGHETKALLNNSGIRAKRSQLERDINKDIISQVVILFLLCLIGAILSGVWTQLHVNRDIVFFPFTSGNANPVEEGFVRFWSFVIIFQVLVPVSLYVTIEIVKFAQVFFMNWDKDMYYEKLDRAFECRALNINEDLGQIKYIFSDKTGTLTENEMVFKCCSIGGKNYLHSLAPDVDAYTSSMALEDDTESTDYPSPPSKPIDVDHQLLKNIRSQPIDPVLHDFFIAMAICNTVVVSQRTHSSSAANGTAKAARVYEAESPDEHALVEGANVYGYSLLSRSSTLIRVKTPQGEVLEFDQLHLLEFSSDRKRMSIIVRNRSSGVVTLYCKGADSVIFSRLSHESISIQHGTQEHLDYYARMGLRTLCISMKVLPEDEYQRWLTEYEAANLDLVNRDELVLRCSDAIERKLHLLGATGIEDRLQDGVQDTIISLRKAGMKVWVLTGDKRETAINVGYASGLLSDSMEILHLKGKTEAECLECLKALIEEMFPSLRSSLDVSHSSILGEKLHGPMIKLRSVLTGSSRSSSGYDDNSLINQGSSSLKALVVDGATLNHVFASSSCRDLFVAVGKQCYSVICCRSSPFQKAKVVELVKESEPSLTLAIGDGANDVSMIQMANIGIGIAGKEGMQAVLASDFNMGRFKFLKKLLLVHGHWCYSRLANMMLYFFYKNAMYAILLFWFQLFNGFSGSNPIDGLNLQIFNLVYTSFPIMIAAVGDQDLKKEDLLKNPSHYRIGQESRTYTRLKFWLIVLEAIYQSVVIFFITYGVYYDSTIGVVEFGFIINAGAVLCASIHMAIEILHWTWIHHFFVWGSLLLFYVLNYVYCAIDTQQRIMDTYFIFIHLSTDSRFWFVQILIPIIALLPRVIAKVVIQDIFPDSVLIGRANEKRTRKNVRVDLDDSLAKSIES